MRRRNTAEKYYKAGLIVLISLTALFFAVLLFAVIIPSPEFLPLMFVPLIYLPFTVYYLVQYIYYRNVTLTNVQTTTLGKASPSVIRGIVGFEAPVYVCGVRTTVTTKRVFSFNYVGSGVNCWSIYSGATVEIGYDEKRNEWIVLSLS